MMSCKPRRGWHHHPTEWYETRKIEKADYEKDPEDVRRGFCDKMYNMVWWAGRGGGRRRRKFIDPGLEATTPGPVSIKL